MRVVGRGGVNSASLMVMSVETTGVEAVVVPGRPRVPLGMLTLVKFFLSASLRLPYLFLGTVSRNLGISVAEGGRLLGLGELAGVGSLIIGPSLDKGRHRRWFLTGMTAGIAGCAVMAGVHSPSGLLIGFAAVCLGVSLCTTSGHSFLGTEIPYAQRGRAIGLFETSWAGALLVGAPVAAVAMRIIGWWSPWLIIALLVSVTVPVAAARMPIHGSAAHHDAVSDTTFEWRAVISTVAASNLLTVGGVVVFSTFGPWLQDVHGVKDFGLGAIAVGLGVMELMASGGSAGYADRIGKRRSAWLGALVMTGAALLLMSFGSTSLMMAIAGIVLLFGGFEFGFVSLLSVVSEVGGGRRATVVGVDHAIVPMMRAGGAALGTLLYSRSGLRPVLVVCILCALSSIVAVQASGAERSR